VAAKRETRKSDRSLPTRSSTSASRHRWLNASSTAQPGRFRAACTGQPQAALTSILTDEECHWFCREYANQANYLDPRASPLRGPVSADLARALVVTAGFDVLRDEGVAYVGRLSEAGAQVDHYSAADMVHGFLSMMAASPAADAHYQCIAAAVRTALHPGSAR
jgi:acetyl esterase/lipase